MTVRIGGLLVGLGVFKLAVGFGVYSKEVRRVIAAGGFATITDESVGAALLWFTFAGALLVLLGLVVAEGEREGHMLPAALAPGLTIVALFACFLMPANGAWLILPIAGLAAHRRRRALPRLPRA